jgi:hypothetical protein
LLRPNCVEQDLDEERAFHIEREAHRLIEAGVPPAEARQRARARFGSTALAADQCRDERGTAFIANTIRDIEYAVRTFVKAPLAAGTIVVTVVVGHVKTLVSARRGDDRRSGGNPVIVLSHKGCDRTTKPRADVRACGLEGAHRSEQAHDARRHREPRAAARSGDRVPSGLDGS